MRYILFILLGTYAFFQVMFYVKNKLKREIAVFAVLFSVSCLYLFYYLKQSYLIHLTDIIAFIYEPLVRVLFEHEMVH